MTKIYEPNGAAREYSPLALNYMNGCDHGCVYCYVPNIKSRFNPDYIHSNTSIKDRSILIKEIKATAKKNKKSEKQVFLSFTTDPYSDYNKKIKLTREVLEILLDNEIPVSILSKGGFNILEDLDLFKKFDGNIKVGLSLTFINSDQSKRWEKGASLPDERFETLKILNDNGVKTWASMEPVIYPDQSLEIMYLTSEYVDHFKIGKLNHMKNHENKFDWTDFLNKSISIMRKNKKHFYIKKDLREYRNEETFLNKNEIDMDFLCLTNNFRSNELLFV